MSYLNTYRNRLSANGGNSSESIIQNSKHTVNNNFSNSLFSETVLIDEFLTEVIITQEKNSEDKKLLLRPDTKVDIGSKVEINGLHYLIIDFLGEGINQIYPTAKLKLTNSTFPIQSNKTRVLMVDDNGNPVTDDDGRPIFIDGYEIDYHEPCITHNTPTLPSDTDQILLPEGRMNITLKYIVADSVRIGQEFEMYGNVYEIYDIDYTKVIQDKGIMTINAKRKVE